MTRYQIHEFMAIVSRHCSVDVFGSLGLRKMIRTALDETDAWEKKKCPLRSPLIMTLILSICLNRMLSIYDVFKQLVGGMRFQAGKRKLPLQAVTEEAVYHARCRVGVAPVERLFEMTAEQVESKASFHGHRTFAADGFCCTVPDTEANELSFGRPVCPSGEAAFPQVKGVTLQATETRGIVAAAFGPYEMPEHRWVDSFLDFLKPGDILLVDRGLPSFTLFTKCTERLVHYLARISSNWQPQVKKVLGPGDYLVQIKDLVEAEPADCRQKNQHQITVYRTVRMIVYTFKSTGEVIRLFTDLVDPKAYPAIELAALYHERWEIELTYDELKTHLEAPPQGVAKTVFRSKTPVGVLQEAYGMLVIYNLVRNLMAKAARQASIDPDQISFVGTLNVIREAIPWYKATPRSAHRWLDRQLLADIAEDRIDRPRRKRQNPRVVKTPLSKFPRKKRHHRGRYFDYDAEIQLVAKDGNRSAA